MIRNVFFEPCGEPIPSTDPWPEQNEWWWGSHTMSLYNLTCAVIGKDTF